jgi:hypothetical protein
MNEYFVFFYSYFRNFSCKPCFVSFLRNNVSKGLSVAHIWVTGDRKESSINI